MAWGLGAFWIGLALIWMVTGWRLLRKCYIDRIIDGARNPPASGCSTKIALVTADLAALGLLGYVVQLYYTVARNVEGGLAVAGVSVLEAFLLVYTAAVFLGG